MTAGGAGGAVKRPQQCRLFLPIAEFSPVAGGMMVMAAADASAETIADAALPLAEMGGDDPAGVIESIVSAPEGIALRARVDNPTAARKIAAGVYAGIVLILRGTKIERAALVDRPDALEKRGVAAVLLQAEGVKVNLIETAKRLYGDAGASGAPVRSILIDTGEAARIEREARDRAAHEKRATARLGRGEQDFRKGADQADALAEIRAALARPGFPAPFVFGIHPR